jgi:nitroreductase
MVLDVIKKRRSIRKFIGKSIPKKAILEILKAGFFAPRAKHNDGLEFIIIKDKETVGKISEILMQPFLKEAPLLIALVSNPAKSVLPIQDISVASENMFLEATGLGIGSVWKNVNEDFQPQIKKLLNVPNSFLLINFVVLGYPDEKIPSHSDSDFNAKKIHRGRW